MGMEEKKARTVKIFTGSAARKWEEIESFKSKIFKKSGENPLE